MRSVIQALWIGGPLSVIGRLSLQSFIAQGHPVHLYCYDAVDGVPPGAFLLDAREILPRQEFTAVAAGGGEDSYGDASMAFRYKLLFERGGWWVDTDVVCLQPFDFRADNVFASEPADASYGGAAASPEVIKQPPGSALMRWALRFYVENLGRPNQIEPRLLHRGIHAFGWQEDVSQPSVFNPVARADWRAFIDPNRRLTFSADVHAVHLWEPLWRKGGVTPDDQFPEACYFEQLKRAHGRDERVR